MKSNYFVIFLAACLLAVTPVAFSKTPKQPSPKSKTEKKQGFMGDPAHKRGYELGYDDGVKAGKLDKQEGKKSAPSTHNSAQSGAKKYKSAYGNEGKFSSGYQQGFVKGYKAGYDREKVDAHKAKIAKKEQENTPRKNRAERIEKTEPTRKKGLRVSDSPEEVTGLKKPVQKRKERPGIATDGEAPAPKRAPQKVSNPAEDAL